MFNTDSQKLGFIDNVCDTSAEQSFDAEINLPDYCPEIQRVLKCSLTPNVVSVQHSNGRITVDVNAKLNLIYCGENGNVSGYEQNYQIQKFIDSAKLNSECAVSVKVNSDYLNCRAVNPRKLEAKGMLTFIFKAEKKRDENILCYADGGGIQLRTEDIKTASLLGVTERAFNIGEVIEIGSDKKSVGNIINISSFADYTDIKMINNKALIKGNCYVKIYYIPDEGESVESVEHSMPISQIVELEGLNDNCVSTLKLTVIGCEAVPKSDSSGSIRLIDLNLRVSAYMAAFEENEITLINDSYSVQHECDNEFKSAELLQLCDSFNTSFTNKVVLESIGVSVECIHAVWCSDLKYNFTAKDEKCSVTGTYTVTVIYKDTDGKCGAIIKPVDFDCSVKLKNKSERMNVIGCAQISGCSSSVTGDSRLELKTEIVAQGLVLSSFIKKYISNIDLHSESKKKNDSCALTIYYYDNGENVWNIARRYNTTVSAVMNENNLTDEILNDSGMILIPSAN